MTDEEINAEMMAMQEKMQAEQEAEMQAAASGNLEVGQAYLAENASADGVQVTESGLQYRVVKAGTGAKPTPQTPSKCITRGALLTARSLIAVIAEGSL
jgi:FKBP-type peptidyl-prolyl cis-trans isomerase